MRKLATRAALLLGSSALFFVLAELAYRALGPDPNPELGALYYADAEFREVDLNTPEGFAVAATLLEPVADAPRFRQNFKPGAVAKLCYRGMEGAAGLDEHGCVTIRYNSCGIRDSEAVCKPKRDGELRVVCLGDSTTVGWGVEIEDSWVRLVEATLRTENPDVTFVNCGASGTMIPDEYLHGLRTRFARFEPDVVLVTMCPNDLLPVNGGMVHFNRKARKAGPPGFFRRNSRILAQLAALSADRRRLYLDPEHDWVGELLALDVADYPPEGKALGKVYWDSGVPQQALRDIDAWCKERGARCAVMLWPFLQQLDSREEHPLTPLHDRVAEFCKTEQLPFLDLLTPFLGEEPTALWVTPKDQHGNPRAHRMAAPAIAEFVRDVLPR